MPNNNSCSSLSLTSALILVRDTIYTFNQISYSTDEKTIENINVLDIEFSILRYIPNILRQTIITLYEK